MSTKILKSRFVAALYLGSILLGASLAEAQGNRPMPVTETAELRRTVETGYRYEQRAMWLEAVKHYKKASKRWPNDSTLTYGLRRTKFQLKIDQRYSDESFEISLLTLPREEALALFDRVLRKVLTEYTENRNVTTFLAHGTESLYLALDNPKFVKSQLDGVSKAERTAVRKWLRNNYWNLEVQGVNGAISELGRICDHCERELNLMPSAVVMEYVFGGVNATDKYSTFLTPDQLDDLFGDIEGEFVGLGIEMKGERGKGMLLVDVLEGSPAKEGGMLPGDYIIGIDGTDIRQMTTDEASRLLRGPKNSRVRITLQDPVTEKVRTNIFSRRPVVIRSFPVVRMIDAANGIGYVKMGAFQRSSAQELDRAIRDLREQGMKALIWDLRGNPGGLLYAAVETLDRFIAEGTLVRTDGRQQDQDRVHTARRIGTLNIPLVVLIDEDSASASEIVAGAIRDHRRGTLVGRKSYGKWSVQSIFNVAYGTGLRVTTAKFYSPNGHNYQGTGISPDVTVELPEQAEHLAYRGRRDLKTDLDVRKGVEVLTYQMARRTR